VDLTPVSVDGHIPATGVFGQDRYNRAQAGIGDYFLRGVPGVIKAIGKTAQQAKKILKRVKFKARVLHAKFKRRSTSATIIAVTGSSGKTTTAALLSHILSGEAKVLSQITWNGYVQAVRSLRALKSDDRYAVLEQGTEGPGNLPRAAELIKPDIAIVTLVAIEHYTAFRSIDAVAKEKSALVAKLSANGLAVLNFDDHNVRAMSDQTRARSITFGTTGGDYIVGDISTYSDGVLSFTIKHGDLTLPLETQLLGKYNWLSVAAAAACALELGIAPEMVRARVASFTPVRGRMSMHTVEGGTRFILDTAKAPYHSIFLPLETLQEIIAPKKRVIVGQISDYSGNATKKYKDTYAAAAKVADEVCFVGPWSHKARPPAADVKSGKFRGFSSIQDLSSYLKETAVEGEVIVVKSASNLHLERLLLDRVDHVRCWATECGRKLSCSGCGLYRKAYHEHNGRNPKRRRIASLDPQPVD
jgi:UDP-N-acetylmuramoyl-tripeptide--D-alanyl-D-alanine ligase